MEWTFERLIETVRDAVKSGAKDTADILTKEYNTPIQTLVNTAWVTSNCSDILFVNLTPLSVVANGTVQVNNYVLQPGGFIGFSGNNAEINKDTYNVIFDSAATSVVVVKKLYTKK